jgi:hypothetical protein
LQIALAHARWLGGWCCEVKLQFLGISVVDAGFCGVDFVKVGCFGVLGVLLIEGHFGGLFS